MVLNSKRICGLKIVLQWSFSNTDTLVLQFVSVLQRFPQFIGHLIHYSTTYTETQNGALAVNFTLLQRIVIERFHMSTNIICNTYT